MHVRVFIIATLVCFGILSSAHATVIRFETTLGNFDVNLHEESSPVTVDNFLSYVTNGALDGTIVHRKVTDFVIQGGGYTTTGASIVTQPPIQLELGSSNQRGTIAMARTSNPNSATSQWFVNLDDNVFLDTSGGGYAVFGEVMGDGMDVVDAIGKLTTVRSGGPFNELPVLDAQQAISASNLVVITRVHVVPEPSSLSMFTLAALTLARGAVRRRI
jgi:peptidyl-prolyl cis-trans isomerase A (cyclophilin A)